MGCYLNNFGEASFDKVEVLILKQGAERQIMPHFIEPYSGKISVCVVQNAAFDAAGIAYSQSEFDTFNDYNDPRHKTWLTMKLEVVAAICPNVLEYIKEVKNDKT